MDARRPSRRRFPRLPAEHVVLVNKVGDAEAEQLARTRNLSLGGCMVTARERLGVGSMVQVLIKVGEQVVDCLGRVAYEIPRRRGELDLGVEFLFLSDADLRRLQGLLGTGAGASEKS